MVELSILGVLGYVLLAPVFLLDAICYFLQVVLGRRTFQHDRNKLASVPRGPATKTHGEPRSVTDGPLVQAYGSNRTLYEMMQGAVEQYGSKRIAMRSRIYLESKKLHESDRFPTKIYDDGFADIDYEELGQRIAHFGCGLRKLGMEPISDSFEGGLAEFDKLEGAFKMVIFENTCSTWTIALQGAFSQSMTVATCYATLGHDAVVSAVQETKATALLVNWKEVDNFVSRGKEMPSLKFIIASLNECGKQGYTPPKESGNLKVVTSDDVLKVGKQSPCLPTPPRASDIACIMYTSGSTGKPKGVVMRHSELAAGLAGMVKNVTLRPGKEIFVSYLPLAHILALQVENVLLSVGATLCYTDPHEMSMALGIYKPTIFGGVPKVYEMLKSGLEKKIDKGGAVIRTVFYTLMAWKTFVLKKGGDTPISNLFFSKISAKVFGGKLQFAISGGGPISAELHTYVRALFNCPVVQGYALTETCVGGCFQALNDPRTSVVGPPVSCVEVVLQSEPDLTDSNGNPYLHTDRKSTTGEPILGRGEICMRGPCISAGYFRNTDNTKEDFDDEGFFHTGDIGQFTRDGVIQIIDRKKNLVKLKGGEYIAIESMETAFKGSKFVANICVMAHGDMDFPLAVVCVDSDTLEQWAKKQGIQYQTVKELISLKVARQEVLASMKQEGTKAGLSNLEMRIKDCCLVDTEWKPGHGMTASMKLDRKSIPKIHAKELAEMYERNGVRT